MSFEQLLSELEALQELKKSAPADEKQDAKSAKQADEADDKNIAAAAEEAGGEAAEEAVDPGDGAGEKDDPPADDDADEEPLGKSFRVTLDNGEVMEAFDGADLFKSLNARFDNTEKTMEKALGAAIDLIKSQGEELAALKTEVKRLGSEGRGRKTVVSVSEKPAAGTMAKAEPNGVSGEEFLSKCLAAQSAGRITALDVSKAEGYLLKGLPVPADIIKRVLV